MSLTDDIGVQVGENTIESQRVDAGSASTDATEDGATPTPETPAPPATPVAPAPGDAAPSAALTPKGPSGEKPDDVEDIDEPEDPNATPAERAVKTRLKMQKRVDKVTANWRRTEGELTAERRERERLENALAEARSARPAPPPEEKPAPVADTAAGLDPSDPKPIKPREEDVNPDGSLKWASWEDLEAAKDQHRDDLAAWNGRREARRLFAERDRQDAERRAHETRARERQAVFSKFEERLNAARAAHPDYDTVVSKDLPANGVMEHVILTSDIGPEISYHLGHHPDECVRLAELVTADPQTDLAGYNAQVANAYREMFELVGLVRAKVSSGKAKASGDALSSRIPSAPPPIGRDRVVSPASAAATRSDDQLTDEEWMDKARRERYGGRGVSP